MVSNVRGLHNFKERDRRLGRRTGWKGHRWSGGWSSSEAHSPGAAAEHGLWVPRCCGASSTPIADPLSLF